MNAARVGRLRERFRRACDEGFVPGGQLAVRVGGELVLDEAHGLARGLRGDDDDGPRVPFTHDTEALVFSAGKPVVGIAVALLESRGLLDVNAPLAERWPAFAAHGKGSLTALDVLTHRAGVLDSALVLAPERWADWESVCRAMESVVPSYPRGTFAYMPYEFGWVLGELVRRVTGKPFDAFVRDELAAPLGWERFSFGVPAARAPSLARAYWLGGRAVVAGNEVGERFEANNARLEAVTSVVPGAGLVTNARTLAEFYAWLLAGTPLPGGARALSPALLEAYTSRAYAGFDRSNRVPLAVGRGFIVGTPWPSPYGFWGTSACFGHQGAFSSLGFADRERGVAFAVVTNGNHGQLATARFLGELARLARALA